MINRINTKTLVVAIIVTLVLSGYYFWRAYDYSRNLIRFQDLTAQTHGTVTKIKTFTEGYSGYQRTKTCPFVEFTVNGETTEDPTCGALRVRIGQKFPVLYNPHHSYTDNRKDGFATVVHPWFFQPYETLNNIYKGLIFLTISIFSLIILKRKHS